VANWDAPAGATALGVVASGDVASGVEATVIEGVSGGAAVGGAVARLLDALASVRNSSSPILVRCVRTPNKTARAVALQA
jgi:hypothetical protein